MIGFMLDYVENRLQIHKLYDFSHVKYIYASKKMLKVFQNVHSNYGNMGKFLL